MPENTYTDIIRSTNPELWPEELWRLLRTLLQRAQETTATPRIHITARLCPVYASPLGDNHDEFNRGLQALAAHQVLTVEWLSNGASARWVRLNAGQQGMLEQLAGEFGPQQANARKQPLDASAEHEKLEKTIIRYGGMGLRTAAHLGFGDSHYFDGRQLPTTCGGRLWVQADAKVEGVNLVRAAGKLVLETPSASFRSTWERPGHYLWEWDIAHCDPKSIEVGRKLVLIENPYPYWELLPFCSDAPVTFVCLHGETLWDHETTLGQALGLFLQKIYQAAPGLETWIWCDPDPSGLLIASNAYRLAQALGGAPRFWMMDGDILARIELLVLGQPKLKPLTEKDAQLLSSSFIHTELQPLAGEMRSRGLKGEQEGLIRDGWCLIEAQRV